MADMEQVYEAIRVADRSGDTESVKKLSEYISQKSPQVASDSDSDAGKQLARGVGLGTRAVAEGVAGLPLMVGDAVNALYNKAREIEQEYFGDDERIPKGEQLGSASQAFKQALTDIGLPEPETTGEKVRSEIQKGAAATMSLTAPAMAAKPASAVGGAVAKELAIKPGVQAVAGATAAGGSEAAEELGVGEVGQAAAGLAGALTGAVGATKAISVTTGAKESARALSRDFAKAVNKGINKAIRPSVSGKQTYSQVQNYQRKTQDAVGSIIDNKQNLQLADDAGNVVPNKLPENLRQFSQSVEQTKQEIFKEYNAMAKESLETITPKTTAAIYKGQRVNPAELKSELSRIGKQITNEQKKAGTEDLLIEAQQYLKGKGKPWVQVVGENAKSYRSRIINEFKKDNPDVVAGTGTSDEVVKLQARQQQITDVLNNLEPEKAMVSLSPIVKELEKIATKKVLKDNAPAAAKYATERAKALSKRGAYTTEETQEAVKILNQSLDSFYKNPSFETASSAQIDALIVNNMRKELDSVITKATGTGYQALKRKYGALKSLEKDINHRMVVDARKNQKGLIDFSDIMTGDRAVMGIMTMNPAAVGQAVAIKSISSYIKMLNDPNKIVKNMFFDAEKLRNNPNFAR